MAALAALSSAIDGIVSQYSIAGCIDLPEGGVTVAAKAKKASVTLPVSRGAQDAALAPLLKAAAASPFGHGKKTVVDASVRSARHLAAKDLAAAPLELGPELLERVRAELVPDAGSVRAVLHKVNFYEAGGHFAKHRDTPRAETQFGSLVVCLPTLFEGGAFGVSHEGDAQTHDWGRQHGVDTRGYFHAYNKSDAEKKARRDGLTPRKRAHWCAFFSDAEHEVRAVTAGCRVTLAFELHRDAPPDPTADALLGRSENVRRAFDAVVADAAFAGGKLAYECRHLYEEKALTSAEKALSGAASAKVSVRTHAKALKNEDAVVAVAARAAGLSVEFLRVVSDGEGYAGAVEVDALPKKKGFGVTRTVDGGFRAKTITPDDLDAMGPTHEAGAYEWVGSRRGARAKIADVEFGEYFGNEASSTTFYAQAMLVITVPDDRDDVESSALTADRVRAAAPKPKAAPKRAAEPAPAPAAASKKAKQKPADKENAAEENGAPATAPARVFAAPAAAEGTAPRTIHVRGGRGNSRCAAANGECDVVLRAGEGIAELKKAIRQGFGKYAHHTMGSLKLGSAGGRNAKKADLVDGATVYCSYTYSAGNPGNLGGRRGLGGFGGMRGFGGFGGGGSRADLMMMMMLMGGGPPGMDSDDEFGGHDDY